MTELQKRLSALAEKEYAAFEAKLNPALPRECFMGIRVPLLRDFAEKYKKEPEHEAFLAALPHETFDENMLHGLLINEIKNYDRCIVELDRFLPYVDNWAVCDSTRPKILGRHLPETLRKAIEWTASPLTYTCRFGMDTLMTHFLDDAFKPEYLEIPASVKSEEYYVNMMIAWYFATALAKQWESTLPFITEHRLSPWVHNKTIQKAAESRRITKEQKELLKKYRM